MGAGDAADDEQDHWLEWPDGTGTGSLTPSTRGSTTPDDLSDSDALQIVLGDRPLGAVAPELDEDDEPADTSSTAALGSADLAFIVDKLNAIERRLMRLDVRVAAVEAASVPVPSQLADLATEVGKGRKAIADFRGELFDAGPVRTLIEEIQRLQPEALAAEVIQRLEALIVVDAPET